MIRISWNHFNFIFIQFPGCWGQKSDTYLCICVCVRAHARSQAQLHSHVQLFATLWTIAHWAPLSIEFSRQEYWSRLPFPTPGDLPDPRIEPVSLMSPAFAGGFFTTSAPWEAQSNTNAYQKYRPNIEASWETHLLSPLRFLESWLFNAESTGWTAVLFIWMQETKCPGLLLLFLVSPFWRSFIYLYPSGSRSLAHCQQSAPETA